jgi:hypothetical protein
MTKATELKTEIKHVRVYQCSDCHQLTLVLGAAPRYCCWCSEKFEEVATLDGNVVWP